MRFAVIAGHHRRWCKYTWIADAIHKAGHAAREATQVGDAIDAERWADVSIWEPKWLQNHAGLPRVCYRVGWMFDLVAYENKPLEAQPLLFEWDGQRMVPTLLLKAMRSCDLLLVKERSLLDEYRAIAVRAAWFDQACPSWMGECQHRESPRWDVLVLGTTRWSQRRKDVAALVDAGFRVGWAVPEGDYGHVRGAEYVPWVPPLELPGLVSDAAVVVDCGARSDLDGYWSDKLWLLAGMGACQVRRWSPGLPVPDAGPKLMTYRNTSELVGHVRSLVRDVERRQQVGKALRKWTMDNHTYEHRIAELDKMLQEKTRRMNPALA